MGTRDRDKNIISIISIPSTATQYACAKQNKHKNPTKTMNQWFINFNFNSLPQLQLVDAVRCICIYNNHFYFHFYAFECDNKFNLTKNDIW